SALLAIASALFFGLGFGRVLQLIHVRAWRIPLPPRQSDQVLYAIVLLGLYGLIVLLLVQLAELKGSPSWAEKTLALGWAALLVVFFVWAPWRLTHRLIRRRDLLPAAILTAVGLVLLMLVSRYVMQFWVDLYAKDYGGLGVILAIYFWLALSSAVIVWAASLSPALAARRDFRRRGDPKASRWVTNPALALVSPPGRPTCWSGPSIGRANTLSTRPPTTWPSPATPL